MPLTLSNRLSPRKVTGKTSRSFYTKGEVVSYTPNFKKTKLKKKSKSPKNKDFGNKVEHNRYHSHGLPVPRDSDMSTNVNSGPN